MHMITHFIENILEILYLNKHLSTFAVCGINENELKKMKIRKLLYFFILKILNK